MIFIFTAVRCPNITIFNGETTELLQGHFGEILMVSCQPGYHVNHHANQSITCQANGTWSRRENCTGKNLYKDSKVDIQINSKELMRLEFICILFFALENPFSFYLGHFRNRGIISYHSDRGETGESDKKPDENVYSFYLIKTKNKSFDQES